MWELTDFRIQISSGFYKPLLKTRLIGIVEIYNQNDF